MSGRGTFYPGRGGGGGGVGGGVGGRPFPGEERRGGDILPTVEGTFYTRGQFTLHNGPKKV